jgi:hypothetical protein
MAQGITGENGAFNRKGREERKQRKQSRCPEGWEDDV